MPFRCDLPTGQIGVALGAVAQGLVGRMVLQIWRNRLTSTARASQSLMGPQSTKYEQGA